MKIDKELLIEQNGITRDNAPQLVDLTVGALYVFSKTGMEVTTHTHMETSHTTAVMQGSVSIVREDNPPEIYSAPSIANFDCGVPHSIKALEDNTIIFNPLKPKKTPVKT